MIIRLNSIYVFDENGVQEHGFDGDYDKHIQDKRHPGGVIVGYIRILETMTKKYYYWNHKPLTKNGYLIENKRRQHL